MPNIKSAKKRVRQNNKRNIENSQKKATIRTFEKKIKKSLESNKLEDAIKYFSIFTSFIDKAAKKKIIHKNKANRKKSRFATLLNIVNKDKNQDNNKNSNHNQVEESQDSPTTTQVNDSVQAST